MQDSARVRVLVTGLGWMGKGAGSIDTALEEMVRSARRELVLLAYAVSEGADALMELIRQRLRAGVRVTMIVDRVGAQHGRVPAWLEGLVRDYPSHCQVFDFDGADQKAHLHAKALIADRECAIVGSANLSWHGLVTNHELAVRIEGPAVAELASAADRLLKHRLVRRLAVPGSGPTDRHSAGKTSAPQTEE